MVSKLKCSIVDDDPEAHRDIIELLKDSPIAEITHSFYKPSEFLEKMHTIAMDVVFLDIVFLNDAMQGFDIAPIIQKEKKALIFISARNEFIVEACRRAGAIDVMPKPHTKERLAEAVMKAWKIKDSPGTVEKEHALFHVKGRKEKISLVLRDIYFVKIAMEDPRNKDIVLKDGKEITLMNCSFKYLLSLSARLARINKSELVSCDIVDNVDHDTVNIKPDTTPKIHKWLTLSKKYRKDFNKNFN